MKAGRRDGRGRTPERRTATERVAKRQPGKNDGVEGRTDGSRRGTSSLLLDE